MPKKKSSSSIDIGLRLRKFRKGQDLTQQAFSEMLGIHFQSLLRYEKGIISPGSDLLLNLKDLFNVNPNWILLGEGPQYLSEDAPQSQAQPMIRQQIGDYQAQPVSGAVIDVFEVPVLQSLKSVAPKTLKSVKTRFSVPKMWLSRPEEAFFVKASQSLGKDVRTGDLALIDGSKKHPADLEGQLVLANIQGKPSFGHISKKNSSYYFNPSVGKPTPLKAGKALAKNNPILGRVQLIKRNTK